MNYRKINILILQALTVTIPVIFAVAPFQFMSESKSFSNYFEILDFIANLLIFIPIGMFIFKEKKIFFSIIISISLGLLIGAIIETVQSYSLYRTGETWDIVANALGTLIGTLIKLKSKTRISILKSPLFFFIIISILLPVYKLVFISENIVLIDLVIILNLNICCYLLLCKNNYDAKFLSGLFYIVVISLLTLNYYLKIGFIYIFLINISLQLLFFSRFKKIVLKISMIISFVITIFYLYLLLNFKISGREIVFDSLDKKIIISHGKEIAFVYIFVVFLLLTSTSMIFQFIEKIKKYLVGAKQY